VASKKSSESVPHDMKFDHGVPFVGPTNAKPMSHMDGQPHVVPTPRPSRFNEFKHGSEKGEK
jgi:hypothetical protein